MNHIIIAVLAVFLTGEGTAQTVLSDDKVEVLHETEESMKPLQKELKPEQTLHLHDEISECKIKLKLSYKSLFKGKYIHELGQQLDQCLTKIISML